MEVFASVVIMFFFFSSTRCDSAGYWLINRVYSLALYRVNIAPNFIIQWTISAFKHLFSWFCCCVHSPFFSNSLTHLIFSIRLLGLRMRNVVGFNFYCIASNKISMSKTFSAHISCDLFALVYRSLLNTQTRTAYTRWDAKHWMLMRTNM